VVVVVVGASEEERKRVSELYYEKRLMASVSVIVCMIMQSEVECAYEKLQVMKFDQNRPVIIE